MRGKEYATVQKGGGGTAKRELKLSEKVLAYGVVIFILLVVLSPHMGLLLLSFGTIWSFAPLPDAYTFQNYIIMWEGSKTYIINTVLYAGIAATLDVIIGTAIAYIVIRTGIFGRKWLDYLATAALAVPGVVLGIGCLRTFHSVDVPFPGELLASWWVIIALALMIRRLPYALRACTAALQQVSLALEEAAESLGATKRRTIQKIVLPLMTGGILAGFVTSFATAAVELSATIMLVSSNSDAPLAYGIYLFMQTPSGRGAGAALGIVAVIVVAIGTVASQFIIERDKKLKTSNAVHCRNQEHDQSRDQNRKRPPFIRSDRSSQRRQSGHQAGRVLRVSWPVGVGKVHAASRDCGLWTESQGPHPDRRPGCGGAGPMGSECRNGVPKLCALAAFACARQRGLWLEGAACPARANQVQS